MMTIVRSMLVLITLSLCAAFAFSSDAWGFARVFTIAAIVQVVLYNVYRQIVVLFAEKLTNDRISEYTKQGVEVTCPCSRSIKNLIPIQLNTDNSYKCLDCARNVTVNVEVKTFLETQPVDLDKSTAAFDAVYAEVTEKTEDGSKI
jgi:hypothetical protein